MAIELRIVGPQFSDPTLFVQWLVEQYDTRPRHLPFRSHDRLLECDLPSNIHVLAAAPAHWDLFAVYEFLLETADAVLLTVNRAALTRHLNSEIVALVEDHARRLEIIPVVAANDPYGDSPEFPTDSTSLIARELHPAWPVFETTVGPFERRLRWSHGATEVWNAAVESAARHKSAG
jgi:hypothetical protein